MGFLDSIFLGARVWVWLYFLLSIIGSISAIAIFFRERLKKKWYLFKYPEKTVRVLIHYKNGIYREYWRLIPKDDSFVFDEKKYLYNDKKILKNNDFYARENSKELYFMIDGNKYKLTDRLKLSKKWNKYAEIHYFYNNPNPLDFDMSKKKISFTATELQRFKENDLVAKLLTLDTEKQVFMMLMVLGVVNLLATLFLISKFMEWI